MASSVPQAAVAADIAKPFITAFGLPWLDPGIMPQTGFLEPQKPRASARPPFGRSRKSAPGKRAYP